MPFVPLPKFEDRVGGRRAAIAYAVRCFKRIEPLLDPRLALDATTTVGRLLDGIDEADEVASTEKKFGFVHSQALKRYSRDLRPPSRSVFEVAVAAYEAADSLDADVGWARGIHSAIKAYEAAQAIGVDISSELREDLMRLDELDRALRSRDKPIAVDQGVFGPLWPNGYPRGWPLANPTIPTTTAANPSAPNPAAPAAPPLSAGEKALILQEFHKAVCDTFKQEDLEQLTRFRLNVRLDHIVRAENLVQTVFQLIEWAEQRGRLIDLARAVMAERDRVAKVQNACVRVINAFG